MLRLVFITILWICICVCVHVCVIIYTVIVHSTGYSDAISYSNIMLGVLVMSVWYYKYTHNILLLLLKQKNKSDDITIPIMFINIMWFNMSVYLVFILSFHILFWCEHHFPDYILLNVSVKWHVINTDLLSIVHLPVCLVNVISTICCHAFV